MQNLKIIRQKKNINQLRVATEIGVSQETISQYENGLSLPSASNLIKLSKFLNCSVDYLLDLTNIPTPVVSKNEQNDYIINEFNSLSNSNKQSFLSYLNYLTYQNNNKKHFNKK